MLGLQVFRGMLQRLEGMAYLWVVICIQQHTLCICEIWCNSTGSLPSRPSSGDQRWLQLRMC